MTETACPSAEIMDAFLHGSLEENERVQLVSHVAACVECREIVGVLGNDSNDGAQTQVALSLPPLELFTTPKVGEVFGGKWRLVRVLGEGGMGRVFEVTGEGDTRAALKVIRPERALHSEVLRRFMRERSMTNRIGHPAFVRVIDEGSTPAGVPYFVMDLAAGETLRQIVRTRGVFDEARAIAIGDQLLDAIAAAHATGILHRDLKPDNVVLDADGSMRILDLGIAKLQDSDGETPTMTGQMLGTPAYMPPEQARGIPSQVDERVDLFSIAATLVFLLTGKAVRPTAGTLFEAMTQPVAPVATLAPHVSPRLARVLDRALSFEKTNRYPSAFAMRAALLGETAPDVDESDLDPHPRAKAKASRPQRTRVVTWVVTATAILALGAGALGLHRRSTTLSPASSQPILSTHAPAADEAARVSSASEATEPRAEPRAPEKAAPPKPSEKHNATPRPPGGSRSRTAPQRAVSARNEGDYDWLEQRQ
jgi:serine/threonine protein kinase